MREAVKFSSTTAKVKYLIMEYMSREDREYERKELVAFINANAGDDENLTDGVIAGAIKILICSGELVTVKRGCYSKGSGRVKATAYEKIYNICNRFLADLERGCTVNILELTETEKESYAEFTGILDDLKSVVEWNTVRLKEVIEQVRAAEKNGAVEADLSVTVPGLPGEGGKEDVNNEGVQGDDTVLPEEKDGQSEETSTAGPEEVVTEKTEGEQQEETVNPEGNVEVQSEEKAEAASDVDTTVAPEEKVDVESGEVQEAEGESKETVEGQSEESDKATGEDTGAVEKEEGAVEDADKNQEEKAEADGLTEGTVEEKPATKKARKSRRK